MRPTLRSIFIALALACASAPAFAQAGADAGATAPPAETEAAHPILIHLAGGGRIEVDEADETADGVWYRRGNVTTLLERARVVRVQREPDPVPAAAAPRTDRGEGSWNTSADLPRVEGFFRSAFKRPLPVSALGQSPVHNDWGYDHRHAVDVGLHPDGPEGRALVEFLRGAKIPFRTFRSAVPGVATGPHIHIGRPSRKFR